MGYEGKKKRDYQLAFVNKRKRDWIKANGGECVMCGSIRNLEVDHIDQDLKKYNPRDIWSARDEIREEELANCHILCESCHEEKTAIQNSKPDSEDEGAPGNINEFDCGTVESYNAGCRCRDCKAAKIRAWKPAQTSATI